MADVVICYGVQEYRLRSGDEEGEPAEYGDPAELEVDGERYMALIYEDDQGNRSSLLEDEALVYRCEVVDDVEFDEYDEVAEETPVEEGEEDGDVVVDEGDEETGGEDEDE